MQKRCPNCGGFLTRFDDDYLLGTRPSGTKVYGKGAITYCKQCDFRTDLAVTLLPWARQEAKEGRLKLNPRWKEGKNE